MPLTGAEETAGGQIGERRDVAQPAAGEQKASRPTPMERLWADDDRRTDDPALVVDVEGFEGPLDLLLHLARNQKVDLARISVLALAEQYLLFIDKVRALRLELAADYLVMAAWLAFLKSKLLIPKQPGEEGQSGEELAAVLQFRLRRLEAMRDAAVRLVNRNRLGRDVFARGMPELVIVEKRNQYSATLYDLLSAYASQRQRQAVTSVHIARRGVWSLKQAREILTRMIGELDDWASLDGYLIQYLASPEDRRTAIASSFAASLELVREGRAEVRQQEPFAPIYLRGRGAKGEEEASP
jgi:segregation and condensation protein A